VELPVVEEVYAVAVAQPLVVEAAVGEARQLGEAAVVERQLGEAPRVQQGVHWVAAGHRVALEVLVDQACIELQSHFYHSPGLQACSLSNTFHQP
jgi:hypothetical protein